MMAKEKEDEDEDDKKDDDEDEDIDEINVTSKSTEILVDSDGNLDWINHDLDPNDFYLLGWIRL
jgi:hypothetical protein